MLPPWTKIQNKICKTWTLVSLLFCCLASFQNSTVFAKIISDKVDFIHKEKICKDYVDGGEWQLAIDCFKGLEKEQRLSDDIGSRSVPGTGHFPNREFGVAYYRVGDYKNAKIYLGRSLDAVESSRAQDYLRKISKKTKEPTSGPVITILSPEEGAEISAEYAIIAIKVKVADPNFIDSIWINGETTYRELGKKEFLFSSNLKLHPGQNILTVKATNLDGGTTFQKIKVKYKRLRKSSLPFPSEGRSIEAKKKPAAK